MEEPAEKATGEWGVHDAAFEESVESKGPGNKRDTTELLW